jgi:hypothetical protein
METGEGQLVSVNLEKVTLKVQLRIGSPDSLNTLGVIIKQDN